MSERLPRSVWLLSLCNAYMYIAASLLITVSALIGFELAPDKRLSTLPLALQFTAIMCGTVPASLLMGRFGRKAGFLLAGVIGVLGANIALWAIINEHFMAFCAATFCFGLCTSFGNYYRFTAAEVVPSNLKSRAIAMVMAGGLIAAFIGPNLASWSGALFEGRVFAGPFLVLMGVYLLSMFTVSLTPLPPAPKRAPADADKSLNASLPDSRRLSSIMAQPIFIVAVTCQMFGYGIMNFVMTSTPLAMYANDYGIGHTAFVIQWHVVAMFAPSFVTGHLINRLGIVPVLGSGIVIGLMAIMINLSGTSVAHFTSALMLLGISWNFLFVGGTTLLTEACRDNERSRTQAVNDLIVFSTVALTALSAGGVHHLFGWRIVNLSVLPLFALTAMAVLWLYSLRAAPRLSAG